MTDFVLVNTPIQEYSQDYKPEYSTTAPMGLGYLATISSRAGFDTKLIDAEAEKLTLSEIQDRINSLNPQTIGVNAFATNYEISQKILRSVNIPNKIIGGPHASLLKWAKEDNHTIVIGESEEIILDVLKNKAKGIVKGKFVKNLDALPFVDRSFFKNDPYEENGKMEASMNTLRGCIFDCVYCAVPELNGRRIRSRSIENILDEIEELKIAGVNSIHFTDDIFNYNPARVSHFCNSMLDRKIDVSWRALARIELVDKNLLGQMAQSGCYKLAFGIESGSSKILKYVGKTIDQTHVKKVFEYCRDLGIQTKGFFTVGYPTETKEEMQETLDLALELNPNEVRFMGVRCFPGTRLYDDMKRKGVSEKELNQYKQFAGQEDHTKYHVVNLKPLNGMSPEQIDSYIKKAYKLFNEGK